MSKHQNSVVEPTEEELIVYSKLSEQITDYQMDELANEYFEKVASENLNISFPRFLIDKIVRPIQPGDTISFKTEEREDIFLFCLIRKNIDNVDYLLFVKADHETQEIDTEYTYLFYVDGKDELGSEIIDIMPSGPETEAILDILEADVDVDMVGQSIPETN